MDLAPEIKLLLARHDQARREDILREATAAARAENRPLSILDIRLAALPRDKRTAKVTPPKPDLAAPVLSESTAVILDTLPQRLKPSEAAAYLGISEGTIMNFRDTSELAFINIATPGARRPAWRIVKDSLIAFELRRQTANKK